MIDSGDEQVRGAMDALRRIVRALRLSAVEIERDVGISVAQLFVLQQLSRGATRSMRELAELTATDPSTVSGVVRRLVDAGLADRKTSRRDARRAEVRLTPRGAALLLRAPAVPQARIMEALSALPRQRVDALAKGLIEVADRLGPSSAPLFFEEEPRRTRRPSLRSRRRRPRSPA
jgi:DNA-binding MarR family transcriptional regulator